MEGLVWTKSSGTAEALEGGLAESSARIESGAGHSHSLIEPMREESDRTASSHDQFYFMVCTCHVLMPQCLSMPL